MTGPSRAKIATAALTLLAGAVLSAPHAGVAQSTTPRAVVASLDLDRSQVGRVTAHFAPADRARTEDLAALVDAAAALFERELALSFAMPPPPDPASFVVKVQFRMSIAPSGLRTAIPPPLTSAEFAVNEEP